MRRTQQIAIAALGVGLAFASEGGAQQAPARRIGWGLDFAGSVQSTTATGNYLGPTAGLELASTGSLSLRADAALQLDVGTRPIVNQNVPDGGIAPIAYDGRLLKSLGTATIAVEAGTRERLSSGGLFVAARLGGGVGRWGPGTVDYRISPGRVFSYREPGHTASLLTAGAEAGLWIPMFGRPHRIALRVDGVHAQDFSTTRLALVVLRHR